MSKHTRMIKLMAAVMAAGLVGVQPLRLHATVTLGTLLGEMIDPERLTRLPEQPYRLLHASSYDRRSLTPDTPSWFDNWDCDYVLRVELVDGRTEYVMMDAVGPGAVVRFWATTAGHEYTLRVYLDGESTPVIEGSLTQSVGREALIGPPLSFVAPVRAGTSTGHNLYLPIPFSQRCKITVSTPQPVVPLDYPHRLYYNIDYRAYGSGVAVESFTPEALTRYSVDKDITQANLTAGHPALAATSACGRIEGPLAWGGGTRSVTLKGPSAVRLLRFKLAAPDLPQALRSTHLEMDVDGETRAVSCPVGDFFGTGCSVTTGRTWFVEAAADGTLSAYWPMPFRDRATLRVVNHGRQPVEILQGEVWSGPYAWDEAASMHFHAAWRDYAFEDTVALKGEDLNYVTLQGQGRLVGDTLSIFNDASTVPSSYLNWWGEGDEKIWVDGETFPSHIGTGTEDYYGYAWCLPQAFSTPFIAQPTGSGNDKRGLTVNTRVRLLDDLPYRSALRFDMEVQAWKTGKHRYAPTVFWYARPGGVCYTPDPVAKSQLPVPRANTSGIESAPVVCPIGVRRETESMTVTLNTGGTVSCVTSNGLGLSGEQCLRWLNCSVGSRLEFGFQASFTGQCALAVRVLAGPASGTLRVGVNGQDAASGVALYAPLTAPATVWLGTHTLRGGTNALTFEVTALPSGVGQGGFAFDYLQNEGPYYVSRALPALRERLEGELLPAQVSCGVLTASSSATNQLSGGACAFWSGAAVGGEAVFRIVSGSQRQVPLTAVFLAATNGATCDILVNGLPACRAVNLFRASGAVTNVILGEHLLLSGTNQVTVRVTGCSAGLDPAALSAGLDCIDQGSLFARRTESQAGSPLTGPYEDPDGDGLVNLVEFAFGGDPARPDGRELWPSAEVLRIDGSDYPAISYRRRTPVGGLAPVGAEGVDIQVDGVVYQVQSSDALGAEACWATTNALGPVTVAAGSPDNETNGTFRVRRRAAQPLPDAPPGARFLRVGLSEP